MSSLADIIFLLLIFFLITSRFVTPNALPVKRPTSTAKTSVTPSAHLSVTADLQYAVDKQMVTFDQLRSVLAQRIAGVEKPVVILNMDKSVSIEKLVELYDMASDMKFELVLSTDPKKQR